MLRAVKLTPIKFNNKILIARTDEGYLILPPREEQIVPSVVALDCEKVLLM